MGTPNFLDEIIHYVENEMGLKPGSVNMLTWTWVLKERMALCNLTSYEDYYKRLTTSLHEYQELVELIVVPETWFFRDKGAFDFLDQSIRAVYRPLIKIMSLPCSSGEEPYSIAMTLIKAKIASYHFVIDAVDISQKALIKAQKGVYGKNSFRGKDLSYRDHFFSKTDEGYVIHQKAKERVHFFHYNVIEEKILFDFSSYHFIFCRNLLIYLSEKAQAKTLKLIRSLLAPDGILFVGPAETQLAQNAGFVPIYYPRAYAFSPGKSQIRPSESPVLNETSGELGLSKEFSQLKIDSSPLEEKPNADPSAPLVLPNKPALLEEATILADQGFFEEASAVCLNFMHQFGASSEVYYLLGLIKHAKGNELKAEEFFRKAIYLDPFHHEALIYLALLAEKKGYHDQAELFRKRAQRAGKV